MFLLLRFSLFIIIIHNKLLIFFLLRTFGIGEDQQQRGETLPTGDIFIFSKRIYYYSFIIHHYYYIFNQNIYYIYFELPNNYFYFLLFLLLLLLYIIYLKLQKNSLRRHCHLVLRTVEHYGGV